MMNVNIFLSLWLSACFAVPTLESNSTGSPDLF